MDLLRTPDDRFHALPGWSYEPHYLDLDGVRIHYVDEGPRSAAPVLLMHGEPSWSFLYRKMIPGLVAAGHRVVAPDLVGFGRSDKPARREDYTYARHVAWMAGVLGALDLQGTTLFCQDWGGLVGLRLVADQPERFARDLVAEALRARVVVVGQNFRFGTKRAGDLALLRSLGTELGFEVRVHGIASDANGPFSSTRAREAIAAGTLDEAERVLGRPHALSGVVVHGQERGRTINVPTANIAPVAEMLPPDGVYAVRAEILEDDGEVVPLPGGVTNIGMRPTVGGTARTVETYLLGFAGDLYDERLRLHLVARLRDEQKFAGLDELKTQIMLDCIHARRKLGLPESA